MGIVQTFAGMRSYSMDGSYNRINPSKDLTSISELHASEVPSSSFGYERVGKPSVSRRASFSWGRRSSKKHFDADVQGTQETPPKTQPTKLTFEAPPTPKTPQAPKKVKKKTGLKNFFNGILDSYKKIMQSAEDVDMQLGDLYPGNGMMAPVTPAAASTRSIKYISPSHSVGRNSLVRVGEESSRER